MTRVLVLAGPCIYRECLARVLDARPGIESVSVADDCGQLTSLVTQRRPDVVLVHHGVAGGIATIRQAARVLGTIPIVVFYVPATEHHTVECFEAGAAGFVWQGGTLEALTTAMDGALRGELSCKPRIAAMLSRRLRAFTVESDHGARGVSLTDREREIVELLDQGLANKDIARRLGIRIPTVKNHIHSILEKLNVHRRGEAAALVHGRLPPLGEATDLKIQEALDP